VIRQVDKPTVARADAGPGSGAGTNTGPDVEPGTVPAMGRERSEKATIIRTGPGLHLVRSASGVWRGKLRGRLRAEVERALNPVCVGDEVMIDQLQPEPALAAGVQVSGTATISVLLPRRTSLFRLRPPPRSRGEPIRQVLAANIDLVVVVVAAVAPPLKGNTINRYLLLARQAEIEGMVIINKTDQCLDLPDKWDQVREVKASLEARSVRVLLTSAERGEGIDLLKGQIHGKTSVFVGPSGVGKTSIIKGLCPALDAKTLTINPATGKGRHATSFASLIDIGGGYVADLPGLRAIGFANLEEETVRSEFPDIEEVAPDCLFNDCTHTREPGCAVLAAVRDGAVAASRYAEFLKVLRDSRGSRVPSRDAPRSGPPGAGNRAGAGHRSTRGRPVPERRTRAARWWEAEDDP